MIKVNACGPGIDNPIGMLRDHDGDGEFSENEIFIFTKDHLNSVRDLTNMNQRLVQRYNYSAYGKVKLERIADASDVRFVENYFTYTSREWEPEVGFVCHRARCQEGNGRWMSEDPIGFNGGDSNLYRFVINNPVKHNDPSGNELTLGGALLVGATVGGVAGAVGEMLFSDNVTLDSVGSAALSGAAGGVMTVVGAGATIVAGGSSVVGAAVGAISGLFFGSAVNLMTDPSIIPSPIKPHTPPQGPLTCK